MTVATKSAPARMSFEEALKYIPEKEREAVIERAAIIEMDGKLPRETAEWNALMDWKRRKNA